MSAYARKAPSQPRSNNRRPPRPQIRARAGLLTRRGMGYGRFHDAERVFLQEGVCLAPMTPRADGQPVGDADGVTLIPTAGVEDIERGALRAVVVPDGAPSTDPREASGCDRLVATAGAVGLPIVAFGDSVGRTLRALGLEPGRAEDAVVIAAGQVHPVRTDEGLREVAGALA